MESRGSWIFGVMGVLAVAAIYEVLEWLAAVTMAPESAERYNGQQGDFFDAQKDMTLAFFGSLLTILAAFVCSFRGTSSQ